LRSLVSPFRLVPVEPPTDHLRACSFIVPAAFLFISISFFRNISHKLLFGAAKAATAKEIVVGRSVLVTGGMGFIGRHLVRELVANGYEVRVLDSLVEQVHSQGEPTRLPGVHYLIGDLRDLKLCAAALEGVDHVAHLAAEVGVGQSMYEISRYVGGNDLATAVLLEAMIGRKISSMVVASSMSVYGEGRYRDVDGRLHDNVARRRDQLGHGTWDPVDAAGARLEPVPTDEEKPVDLASIYALTKYAQERAAMIFGRAYDVPTVALRLFNVFGAGQALSNPYTGVLANFASRIANGQPPLVFEDGEQQRDFVHVEDVARAFRLALEAPSAAGEVINVGSGRAYSITQVARLLADAMGRPDLEPEILGKIRIGDIRHCFASIERARTLLGFRPQHLLEETLDPFVEWVRRESAVDHSSRMRGELESRGLVA
jgi:dTDP-L-rhamnose 4-epimerase